MSASHPSIDCDGGTGGQVIADPRDNPFPECTLPRQGGRHHQYGGRHTSESALVPRLKNKSAPATSGQERTRGDPGGQAYPLSVVSQSRTGLRRMVSRPSWRCRRCATCSRAACFHGWAARYDSVRGISGTVGLVGFSGTALPRLDADAHPEVQATSVKKRACRQPASLGLAGPTRGAGSAGTSCWAGRPLRAGRGAGPALPLLGASPPEHPEDPAE